MKRFSISDLKAMDEATFKLRTKTFVLRTVRLVDSLPATSAGQVIGRQLLRSSTSIGANY